MLSYLNIEFFLLKKSELIPIFKDFLESDEDYIKCQIDNDLYEIWEIILTIKSNKKLIDDIHLTLFDTVFKDFEENGGEVRELFQPLKIKLDMICKNNNNLEGLSYLTAVWVFIGFCNSPNHSEESFLYKELMYFHRSAMLAHLSKIFKKFDLFISKRNNFNRILLKKKCLLKACLIIYHSLVSKNLILKKNIFPKDLEDKKGTSEYRDEGLDLKNEFKGVLKNKNSDEKIKNPLKSEVFFALKNPVWVNLSFANLQIHLIPPVLSKIDDDYFFIANHYSKCGALIRKNQYSHGNSFIGDVNFIKIRSSLKLHINWEFFDFIKVLIFKNYNLDFQDYRSYFKLTEELKKKLWLKIAQKNLSQIYPLIFFILVDELRPFLKDGFYFRYYFDFRGRLYADSPISYTNNIWFRYCFFYGNYKKSEIEDFKKKIEEKDIDYFPLILENLKLNDEFELLDLNDKFNQYYLSQIFLQFGKIFKNNLVDLNNGCISREDFIKLGLENFNSDLWVELDLNKQIELWSLKFILIGMCAGIYKKIPLFRDATASGIQVLTLLLDVKSFDYFRWVNFIDEDIWYDTYYLIIDVFKKKFFKNNTTSNLEKYFNRKNLKKTIMTYNYNATYLRCWKNFKKEAELFKISEPDILKSVEEQFKNFYNFLNWWFIKDNFYKNSPKLISLYFSKLFIEENCVFYKTHDDFFIALKYFLIGKTSRFDRMILGERVTMVLNELSTNFNQEKTKRALQANITHTFDAYILRKIILIMDSPLITIHDSVGVDILQIKNFEEAVKLSYFHVYTLDVFNLNNQKDHPNFIKSNFIFL